MTLLRAFGPHELLCVSSDSHTVRAVTQLVIFTFFSTLLISRIAKAAHYKLRQHCRVAARTVAVQCCPRVWSSPLYLTFATICMIAGTGMMAKKRELLLCSCLLLNSLIIASGCFSE